MDEDTQDTTPAYPVGLSSLDFDVLLITESIRKGVISARETSHRDISKELGRLLKLTHGMQV